MLTSSISNTKWYHSVGESCNFIDSYVINFGLAGVIGHDFGQFVFVCGRCYWHIAIGFCNLDFVWLVLLPCYFVI